MPLDRRTDIWSFGCVLVRDAHRAARRSPATRSRTRSPRSSSASRTGVRCRHTTPAPVRTTAAALPRKRIASGGLLTSPMRNWRSMTRCAPRTPKRLSPRPPRGRREPVMWASTLMLVGLVGAAALTWAARSVTDPSETTRTLLSIAPTDQVIGSESTGATTRKRAPEPDGDRPLARWQDTGVRRDLGRQPATVHAQRWTGLSVTPIPGTSGATSPFFSPDGRWIGFGAAGELRKVPLTGGPAVTLCKAAALFGASWGSDGTIVFATARNGGLLRVSAEGGTPEALTTLQPGEYSHRLPHMLPGGHAVIFTISKGANLWDNTQIVVRSLSTGDQTVLIEGGADGRYVSTGHIVYARLGTLMAVPFDPSGSCSQVARPASSTASCRPQTSTLTTWRTRSLPSSRSRTRVRSSMSPAASCLRFNDRWRGWIARERANRYRRRRARIRTPRLSPDGRHVAAFIQEGIRQVWSYDIARGALSAVTVDGLSSLRYFCARPETDRFPLRSGGR